MSSPYDSPVRMVSLTPGKSITTTGYNHKSWHLSTKCCIWTYLFMYKRKNYPTASKLLWRKQFFNNESWRFMVSYSSFLNIAHNIGFKYEDINRRKLLFLESSDAVSCKCQFIHKFLKQDVMNVVWLNKTCKYFSHHVSKECTNRITKAMLSWLQEDI